MASGLTPHDSAPRHTHSGLGRPSRIPYSIGEDTGSRSIHSSKASVRPAVAISSASSAPRFSLLLPHVSVSVRPVATTVP